MNVIHVFLRVGIEMFSNMFLIRGDESEYFNIREEESVIQASLREGVWGWSGVIYSIHKQRNNIHIG